MPCDTKSNLISDSSVKESAAEVLRQGSLMTDAAVRKALRDLGYQSITYGHINHDIKGAGFEWV